MLYGELQNLQLTHNCVSVLPVKTKTTQTAHFEVSCHSVSLLNRRV